MSFLNDFNLINSNKDDHTSKKEIYKYRSIYDNDDNDDIEYYYSDILSRFKKYIFHLQNLFTNSYKSINLYVIQNDVNHHQILFVSKDSQNTTIRREKFEEDLTIDKPFEVFIQIETINVPIYLTTNTPEIVLRPTFKLKSQHYQRTYEIEERILYFYTKTIEKSPHTKEEIYNLCIPYLFNLQNLYKREKVNNWCATKSCYELSIKTLSDEEAIYYCEIDREGGYIDEDKIYVNLEPSIHYRYKIKLTITLIYDQNQESDSDDDIEPELEHLRLRLQNLSKELESYQNKTKVTNKCIKSDTCCICLSNPSNIIFTDCGHLCICGPCNEKLTELKCPICRTEITQPRLII